MSFLVYKITNTINGKLYFGVTKCSLQKRWNEHKHSSLRNKKKTHLCLAIKKYGIDNFTIELVKNCLSDIEMYNLEIEYIKTNRTNEREFGYNNSKGGEKSSFGKTLTDETKLKISEYQTKRERMPHSETTKYSMRIAALKNKSHLNLRKYFDNRKGKPAHNKRKIYSIDTNGCIIKYDSLTDASNKTGILITSICNNLINKSKKAGGLKWNYQQQI